MMKKKILLISFIFTCINVSAQDDLMAQLEANTPKIKEYVSATFKSTRLINFHTIETGGSRSLDFRISHHFGDLNGGAYQMFGLDGGASIRLGLEYSYDGNLQFGIGRSSLEKMYDGFAKYRILKQTIDNSNPISVTLISGMYCTTLKDPNITLNGTDRFQYFTSRLSYAHQIVVARKFNKSFSFQIAPTFVHYNLVDKLGDKNDLYTLAFATRYKFSKRSAITMEYGYRLNKYSSEKYYDSVGIGIDVETGGHVFQMFFTNSAGMLEPQFFGRTTSRWQNFGLKLGFNISRIFTV